MRGDTVFLRKKESKNEQVMEKQSNWLKLSVDTPLEEIAAIFYEEGRWDRGGQEFVRTGVWTELHNRKDYRMKTQHWLDHHNMYYLPK